MPDTDMHVRGGSAVTGCKPLSRLHLVYGFLTTEPTEPNAIVEPIHPKANRRS